jgi:16S rRNA G1207 methylase RsmC
MKSSPLSTNGGRGIFCFVPPRNRTRSRSRQRPLSPPGVESRPVEAYVNKIVPFRFSGHDMTFRLSHGLFSSFDIDEGTRLLLKSIAQRVDLGRVGSLLDVGCGVGVIGVSIKCKAPHVRVLMQDRDALAAEFARENALANKAECLVDCGLAFWHLAGSRFDLVTFNIPAKAGEPVLRSLLEDMARCLAPEGRAAFVIVASLAELALDTVRGLAGEIVHQERTHDYLVLHFRKAASSGHNEETAENLQPYIRNRHAFSHGGISYELDTAWSMPDFDTLGYALQSCFDIVEELKVRGEILVWNPGQGHLPASILNVNGSAVEAVRLAGRDSLELAVAAHNLVQMGGKPASVSAVPFEAGLPDILPAGSVDFLCASPHPVPRAPWQQEMARAAGTLLKPGGRLLLVSTSTEVHRFLADLRGFLLLESRKRFGFRAVLLKSLFDRQGQGTDGGAPGLSKRPGAGVQRRPRRKDVIEEKDT